MPNEIYIEEDTKGFLGCDQSVTKGRLSWRVVQVSRGLLCTYHNKLMSEDTYWISLSQNKNKQDNKRGQKGYQGRL